ncbi:hypothetical protein GCM10023149_19950 [Mucilaginibacter gynuensis]|uniref:Polyketide cyclase/dehydrase/lipid transport protein n=1 Tax=Mucilaginibacter gynuensis TaxID=1302236 RepID=A0ABP8GAA3_9SPHI
MIKPNIKRILLIVVLPLVFALIVHSLFNLESLNGLFTIMSVSFIFLVPFGIGALTIFLSGIESVKKMSYRVFTPWIPILAFMLLTMLASLEGWACWLMVLPLFLGASSLGGMVAGHYKLKKHRNENTYISVIALLPLLASPVERYIGDHPSVYKAYTYIDIKADKSEIWPNVTRVRAIKKDEDKGWLTEKLGFPRPIRAELNYNGVGGYRKAIFDKGLIFHEEVTDYKDQQEMSFTIKANPYEIQSTTMDEHVVIGGRYFDVMDGTYQLQQLNATTYRLYLYSHFKLTTTFNLYASLWAEWIMKDIQNNILQVIKERSELKSIVAMR